MDLQIRCVRDEDAAAVVRLSLLAWEPVFRSFEEVLGHAVYSLIWPEWRTSQAREVEALCREGAKLVVWVAEVDGMVVGFVACDLNIEAKRGEVQYLAVDPAYQNRGIGTALNMFVLERMKESGIKLAVVETGGDPSHAPARTTYEKAGYTPLPIVRYFKGL